MDAQQFQQFLQLQRQCATSNSHKLREFDASGDTATNWRRWRHNFTLAVEINNWRNARARNELASNMVGKAKSATVHIPIEADDANPIADLLARYDDVFMPRANTTYLRIELAQACQKHDESILEWHNRCRELHQRAHDRPLAYDWNADVQLRDDFIRGLSSKKFKEGVMNRRPQDYQEALTHAHEAYAVDRALNPKPNSSDSAVSAISGRFNLANVRCHYCLKLGHLFRNCRDRINGLPKATHPPPTTRAPSAAGKSSTRNSYRGRGGRGRGGRGASRGSGRGARLPRDRLVAALSAIEDLYLDAKESIDTADTEGAQADSQLDFAEAYGEHDHQEVEETGSADQGNE